jgi:hypothetical protein
MPRIRKRDRELLALFRKAGLPANKFVNDSGPGGGPGIRFRDSFMINGQEFGFFYKKNEGWVIESYCLFSDNEIVEFLKQIPKKHFTSLMYDYEDEESGLVIE